MKYHFRVPTSANIWYGDIDTWLNDWHSLHLLLEMQDGFVWGDEDIIRTKLSDIAGRLRESGLIYNGFDWEPRTEEKK